MSTSSLFGRKPKVVTPVEEDDTDEVLGHLSGYQNESPAAEDVISFEEDDADEREMFMSLTSNDTELHGEVLPEVASLLAKDPFLMEMKRNRDSLLKKYPKGGLKTSRFITSSILMRAPADFFDKYDADVMAGVDFVRDRLAEDNRTSLIRDAQENPTDDAFQDDAFYVVQNIASSYASNLMWKDIERQIVVSMIIQETIGMSRLDPLWSDRRIDEIIVHGARDIIVEVGGELSRVPAAHFVSTAHLEGIIERFLSPLGKRMSQMTPLVKGRFHDKSRIHVTHTSVAPFGPNMNIRRHPEGFWTPDDSVNRGVASQELMADLGNLIHKGASMVVCGGTHSGKTTLLNALTGFYKPRVHVLTLEDNLEMKPNPKKFLSAAMECRPAAPDRTGDKGVSMRDLVKASLQMRPDVIIVGEVTDGAAYDMVQALNTGHAGASTYHAKDAKEAIPRISSLIAEGGTLTAEASLELIASAFDIVITVKHFPVDGSRRIVSVDEIDLAPEMRNGRVSLGVRKLWQFVETGIDSEGMITGYWEKVNDLSDERVTSKYFNLERDLTWDELKELSSVPESMKVAAPVQDITDELPLNA